MLFEPAHRQARDRLWQVAVGQRGYFAADQAREAGYSYQAQRYHVRIGNWVRVDRGIFRFREFAVMPGEEHDHLVRWWLWSKRRAVVSHESALAVHDLGVANPAKVHLTVPRGFKQQSDDVVLHRAELADDEVRQYEGFRVTTPARAIAESAAARVGQDILDSAVAELLARGEVTPGQLRRTAERLGPRAELGVQRALEAELQ